jgi:hypothetical protein
MTSFMSSELKVFRDSLSNSFALFSFGLAGLTMRDDRLRLSEAFNVLLDHEIQNFERRLADKENIQSMSTVYLEKHDVFSEHEEKDVVVQPPTLVIHPEPSVVVTKYDAPITVANEITMAYKPPPSSVVSEPIDEEEVGDEEEEEVEEVEDEETEEVEDEEETEIKLIGKKKYHVGVISNAVYKYIDDESAGELLGTLTNGKIVV